MDILNKLTQPKIKDYAKKIKNLRQAKHFTLAQAANLNGLSEAVYRSCENATWQASVARYGNVYRTLKAAAKTVDYPIEGMISQLQGALINSGITIEDFNPEKENLKNHLGSFNVWYKPTDSNNDTIPRQIAYVTYTQNRIVEVDLGEWVKPDDQFVSLELGSFEDTTAVIKFLAEVRMFI